MAQEILTCLRSIFGDSPKCELNYNNAFHLLVAIILSAQCTDKRVNMVTPKLFAAYPTVQSMADADVKDIERLIHSCGFYRNKAANIKAAARSIVEEHGGFVPATVADLMKLPGVGEKTASVFVSEFHNVPAIGVDTHVMRVSGRLGLSGEKTPSKIARDLEKLLPPEDWRDFHLLLVLFGRYICTAKKPKCDGCEFSPRCQVYKTGRSPERL